MVAKDSPPALDRHFSRRLKAAKEGVHLPTEIELLRGMPFLSDDIATDIRAFGERLSRRLKYKPQFEIAPLVACLDDLAVDQSVEALQCVGTALNEAHGLSTVSAHDARLRILFYLASCGEDQAAAAIAGETASIAFGDVRDHGDYSLVSRALAWALVANNYRRLHRDGLTHWPHGRVARDLKGFMREFDVAIKVAEPKVEQPEDEPFSAVAADYAKTETTDGEKRAGKCTDGVVVFTSIGNESTSEGKRVVKEFEKFLNIALPLPPVPDLARVRMRLAEEFPYAVAVIDQLLKRLAGRDDVYLRPTILVGTPGCGKTRLVRRLCEELAAPYELLSCGGMNDSAIGGASRRWSSGEPSVAVMAVRRHRCAGPVIVLDEIEKVGTSRHNGNVHDVLVGLLEKETSARWFDPYVESACDLSHVSWVMTANTTAGISSVLLDRCRVIPFPEPGPQHLEALAPRILEHLYVDTGHDPRWSTPIEQFELAALADHWRGGSIRKLRQLLEALLEARDRHRPRQ